MGYEIRPNLLVTNYHCVEDLLNYDNSIFSKEITVTSLTNIKKDGIEGKVVYVDPKKDLAFIEYKDSNENQYIKSLNKIISLPLFTIRSAKEYFLFAIKKNLNNLRYIITKNKCSEYNI